MIELTLPHSTLVHDATLSTFVQSYNTLFAAMIDNQMDMKSIYIDSIYTSSNNYIYILLTTLCKSSLAKKLAVYSMSPIGIRLVGSLESLLSSRSVLIPFARLYSTFVRRLCLKQDIALDA